MQSKLPQLCPILCDPMDSSPPVSRVHGILQARRLEWVAISFSITNITTSWYHVFHLHLFVSWSPLSLKSCNEAQNPHQDKDCYEENWKGEELTSLAENVSLSWSQARAMAALWSGREGARAWNRVWQGLDSWWNTARSCSSSVTWSEKKKCLNPEEKKIVHKTEWSLGEKGKSSLWASIHLYLMRTD